MTSLPAGVLARDLRALARAATVVENRAAGSDELLRELFPHTGRATVVGITGAPGSGKSTLTSTLVTQLRSAGHRVGVLAVDPSSPFTGGAILGDRIRMLQHGADPDVFIRSMATRGALGGLAATTADLTLLLDAAGYDWILVETVGVGQDETEIVRLADVTVVVLVPNLGDDIQALKAGILEIADLYVINKSDLDGADKLEREIQSMLALATPRENWTPPILKTIASNGSGIAKVLDSLRAFMTAHPPRRSSESHWAARLREMYLARVADRLDPACLREAAVRVASRAQDPYSIIEEWLH